MLRTLLVAGAALSIDMHSASAQALWSRPPNADSLRRITTPSFSAPSSSSAASVSPSAVGAIIGGAAGLTAGLIIGHGANVGCRLGDTGCSPQAKQAKAMIVSAVLLGGIGAGLGYFAGKLWRGHAEHRAQSTDLRTNNP
jgi:hypothetical protein